MATIFALLFAAACTLALGMLCGFIVGIEEERRRVRVRVAKPAPEPRKAADPIEALGITKLG